MNAFKKLFGLSTDNKNANVLENSMNKLNLFSQDTEVDREKHQKNLESKAEKYRKKYHEQRRAYKNEHEKCKDNVMKLSINQEKIENLTHEIDQKKKENDLLEDQIAVGKKKLIEITAQLDKVGRPADVETSSLNLSPSLTSLQHENLKEKLVAKNKRVAELEDDLANENQKMENLMKEITFLKIELGKA